MSHDFIHNLGSIHNAVGYGQRYLQSYASYYADHNVWLDRERNYRPSGRIYLGDNLVPERRLVTSQFYTEWLLPQDLHHRLCAVLVREHATAVFLEVTRPRAWPGFDRHDIKRCRLLLPHLQRALRMQHRLSELEVERTPRSMPSTIYPGVSCWWTITAIVWSPTAVPRRSWWPATV